jgi:hypothetical protein
MKEPKLGTCGLTPWQAAAQDAPLRGEVSPVERRPFVLRSHQ